MEILHNLELGLLVASSGQNLMLCFVGVLLGTLVGVLPGIGPTASVAMLLPLTLFLPPTGAMIMLAGIYYGCQYGGSTTAILVNLPGEASTMITCIDGHQMARNGRAGAALTIAALGSFFAGTIATFLIAAASPPLALIATSFSAAEYFSLMVLGLMGAVVLAHGSVIKAIGMVCLGLLLGMIGTDVNSGAFRFTMGIPNLLEGINFGVVAMGLFGISEIMANLGTRTATSQIQKVGSLYPSRQELRDSAAPVVRGTAIGSLLGLLPGSGALISSIASYAVEKGLSRHPERFGKGAVEGVAGPESANNAGAQTSFIPMLTLGIPSNPVMAMMIGALMMQGIVPGPLVMEQQPELFWGLIASMWIGNLMLLVINLPLIGLWVKLLSIPYRILFPAILVICAIGVYSLSGARFDIFMLVMFGALGYFAQKLGCELAPLVLGFILAPMLEENLRRALLLADGSATTFFVRPLSAFLLCLAAMVLLLSFVPSIRRSRRELPADD